MSVWSGREARCCALWSPLGSNCFRRVEDSVGLLPSSRTGPRATLLEKDLTCSPKLEQLSSGHLAVLGDPRHVSLSGPEG